MKKIITVSMLSLGMATQAFSAKEIEVLHYWTSGSESKAVNVLKEDAEKRGVVWKDLAVAGGAGDAARQAVRARVLAGNPPGAYQIKGPSIQEWYEEYGLNTDIDSVAKKNNWDSIIPPAFAVQMKCDGKYCAAPVNVHRVDQMYTNLGVLKKAGVHKVPKNWEEFNKVAEKLQAKGITVLAHGGQAWQDATLFEVIAISLGGADYYQKAFVDLDEKTLAGPTTVKVFDQFRKMRGYVDKSFSGRDWNLATNMVAKGDAAFQIMGDWAKGELLSQGVKLGTDVACTSMGGGYLYNIDSFAFFKQKNKDKQDAQKIVAGLIVGKKFQITFNKIKGSIPARTDIDTSDWDTCAAESTRAMKATSANGTLKPSYAHGMAMRGNVAGAITDVVTNFFNTNEDSSVAARKLAKAVASNKD